MMMSSGALTGLSHEYLSARPRLFKIVRFSSGITKGKCAYIELALKWFGKARNMSL